MRISDIIGNENINIYLNTYRQTRKASGILHLEEECDCYDNISDFFDNDILIFKFISNGTSRAVFDIGDYVLKIALYSNGAESNKREYKLFNKLKTANSFLTEHLAIPYYISKNGMCLIMEKLKEPIKEFTEKLEKEIDKYSIDIYNSIGEYIEDLHENNIMINYNKQWKIIDYAC